GGGRGQGRGVRGGLGADGGGRDGVGRPGRAGERGVLRVHGRPGGAGAVPEGAGGDHQRVRLARGGGGRDGPGGGREGQRGAGAGPEAVPGSGGGLAADRGPELLLLHGLARRGRDRGGAAVAGPVQRVAAGAGAAAGRVVAVGAGQSPGRSAVGGAGGPAGRRRPWRGPG